MACCYPNTAGHVSEVGAGSNIADAGREWYPTEDNMPVQGNQIADVGSEGHSTANDFPVQRDQIADIESGKMDSGGGGYGARTIEQEQALFNT